MKKSVFFPFGMGIGEETKGAWVKKLATTLPEPVVLRTGGCQAAHTVLTDQGSYTFSHFGCGTLDAVPTHLHRMVIDPLSLLEEVNDLTEQGLDPFSLLTISEDCICVTPFHGATSRIREILRSQKKGTIGMGVGEVIRDARIHPELTIRVRDFGRFDLFSLLDKVRLAKLAEVTQLLQQHNDPQIRQLIQPEMSILMNIGRPVEQTAFAMQSLQQNAQVVSGGHLQSLAEKYQNVVVESSHGVLLHPQFGFLPHVTQVDPLAAGVMSDLLKLYASTDIYSIGVIRSYSNRHGAGPLVTEDRNWLCGFAEPHNDNAEWLGPFRQGPLDLVMLKYSLAVSQKVLPSVRGIFMSHLDAVSDDWAVCEGYECPEEPRSLLEKFFELEGERIIGIRFPQNLQGDEQRQHQEQLTQLLFRCQPLITTVSREGFLLQVESSLGVPVLGTATGPRDQDRTIRFTL